MNALAEYAALLERKAQSNSAGGFEPTWLPDTLIDFQAALCDWKLRQGRGLVSADCGLGKTFMQLVCAENVVRHTNRPVLLLTPLAVARQTIREGEKFGIECERSSGGTPRPGARIIVTNYEKLHLFSPDDFAGVVCDESSILKSFDGARRHEITQFMRKHLYRSLWTATAAPNDYTELGTSSEALGYLGHIDMLNRFFKNDLNNTATGRQHGQVAKWRFKGHAEGPFWRWVCSWARACRKPSDLGFSDERFVLPKLIEQEHVVEARTLASGQLFAMPAVGLREEREERRRTITERCEMAASLVTGLGAAVVWCHLNDEGDLLEQMLPDFRQVKGSQSDEEKEEIYEAFVSGQLIGMINKPKMGAWGQNWQHCRRIVTFASHSYEQYYQLVRRCWRFGQTEDVTVHQIVSEGERGVLANQKRKAVAADRMFTELVAHMNDALRLTRSNNHVLPVEVPSWM